MNRRPDIIIYAISFLLLIGAASLWWQGVFPSSSRELVLLPDVQSSARHSEDGGGSSHYGTSGALGAEGGHGMPGDYGRLSNSGNGDSPEQDNAREIFVHVTGAVKSPGVYRLREGQRIYEALKLAEPLDGADVDFLNLAGLLYDQDKIYVPKKGEFDGSGGPGQGTGSPPGAGYGSAGWGSSGSSGQGSYGSGSGSSSGSSPGSGSGSLPGGSSGSGTGSNTSRFPLNINTASARELEALPGIGPAKAEAIVAFRTQRGPFAKKEDIKKVSGIGEVTYSKIENLITLR
jgi:competence protein ComEA